MHVSTGVNKILKSPAVSEPPADLIAIGKLRNVSYYSQSARKSVFEKVSPNLDNGP